MSRNREQTMSSFPNSPKLLKGGLVVLDATSSRVRRVISLQYNPDSLSRSLQVQGAGAEGNGERAQPFRLKGPAIETIKLEADIDATDQLEHPEQNANAVAFGIAPQLAVLEGLINPTSDELLSLAAQSAAGTLEILPPEAPLTLFVWSKSRVVPVRVTEFSITEEAFDVALNPIRAKVSLGLRVLTTDDLGYGSKGGTLFMSHLRNREALAKLPPSATLATLGISNLF
jgi:hypothetical protein